MQLLAFAVAQLFQEIREFRALAYLANGCSKPAKSEHIDAIRSALIRSLETRSPGFRELQSHVGYWERLGYEGDPRRWLIDDYAELEFADIEAFHADQVAVRPVTLMMVGDPRRVDIGELERYGEVIEVAERDVFGR